MATLHKADNDAIIITLSTPYSIKWYYELQIINCNVRKSWR